MRIAWFVVLALVGCKKPEEAAPVTTDLELVSAGLAPLHELRYIGPKGQHTTLELAIEGRIEAGDLKSASPGLVVTLDIAIDDVLADGRMKLRSTIVDATTHAAPDQPGAPHALDAGAHLKGLAITATLSPDGRIADVHADADDKQLTDAARAQLAALVFRYQQLAMPLPTAAVGIGAKWRSARAFTPDNNALKLTSVTTIDVTGIAGSTFSFAMTSEVHGADQTVAMDGTSIDVKGVTGTSTGHGTVDLTKLVMIGTLSAELHMDMTASGERTPMLMANELTTRLP